MKILHSLRKKQTPRMAKMIAKSDMMDTVRICESLKKSFESYSMSLPILLGCMSTIVKVEKRSE